MVHVARIGGEAGADDLGDREHVDALGRVGLERVRRLDDDVVARRRAHVDPGRGAREHALTGRVERAEVVGGLDVGDEGSEGADVQRRRRAEVGEELRRVVAAVVRGRDDQRAD